VQDYRGADIRCYGGDDPCEELHCDGESIDVVQFLQEEDEPDIREIRDIIPVAEMGISWIFRVRFVGRGKG
jgi:hypothetical protein